MSLVNVGFYYSGLFWDGRVQTLEEQSLHPIEDPIEQGNDLDALIEKLKVHEDYAPRFRKAFGIVDRSQINRKLIGKAIAQWERIIISGNSRYDQYARGEISLTDEEDLGHSMFFDFDDGFKDAKRSREEQRFGPNTRDHPKVEKWHRPRRCETDRLPRQMQ